MWTTVGYLAAFCGTLQLIPEIIKASKTHHLKDVSWGMLILMLTSSVLWGSYGVNIHDIPLVISATANFAMETALLLMKKHYELTGKPLKHFLFKKEIPEKNLAPATQTETVETQSEAPSNGL